MSYPLLSQAFSKFATVWYRRVLIAIRSNKPTFVWAFLLVSTFMSCRNFEDVRTPYKSSVMVKFVPQGKGDRRLNITSINRLSARDKNFRHKYPNYELPLDPKSNSTTFVIESDDHTSPNTITIKYQRIASLVSHKIGAQQEFVLQEVRDTFAGKASILNDRLSILNDEQTDVQIYF